MILKKITLLPISTLLACCLVACGPRILIATGTTIGMKATPGDTQTKPPQVTFGYKRAEMAVVPTGNKSATSSSATDTDAFSTLATIDFETSWFGSTSLHSAISSGIAARDIQNEPEFQTKFQEAALEPDDLVKLQTTAVDEIASSVIAGSTTDETKLKAFFTCIGKNDSIAAFLAKNYAGKSKDIFVSEYSKNYAPRAPSDSNKCLH